MSRCCWRAVVDVEVERGEVKVCLGVGAESVVEEGLGSEEKERLGVDMDVDMDVDVAGR